MLPFFVTASLLLGCEQLQDVQETIDGLTDTLVLEAFLIGVVPPDSDLIDLEDTDFSEGASLKAFLADAANIDNIEENALDGAEVAIKSSSLVEMVLEADGGGLYMVIGTDGLEYFAGEDYVLAVTFNDSTSKATVSAPPPVEISIPEDHQVDTNLLIDLTDFDYDAVLVAVMDVQSSQITYSNEPDGVQEIYDFTHGEDSVNRHEIPASAFSAQSVYAVGVAGMRNAGTADYTDMNTGLSSFMVGQMRFYPVSTLPGGN